jgi:hypothetical protein
MRKLLLSVTALPLKAGTWALLKTVWMQAPTGVPAKGGERLTEETGPSVENVMLALPVPVGPPSRLQAVAELAAMLSEVRADARLSGAR